MTTLFPTIVSSIEDYAYLHNGSVYYQIQTKISTGGAKPLRTEAWRRFSDFDELHNNIKNVRLPWFPSKMFGTDPLLRMEKLEIYLNQVFECCGGDPEYFPECLSEFVRLPNFSNKKGIQIAGLKENNKKLVVDKALVRDVDLRTTPQKGKPFVEPEIPTGFFNNIQNCYDELERVVPLKKGMQGWENLGSKDDINVMVCNEASPPMRKVTAKLNCPPRAVHEILWKASSYKEVFNLKSLENLGRIDNHTKMEHMVRKSMLLPSRDIVLLRHWRVNREGEIAHTEFDVDHPEVPIGEKHVRAQQSIGGTFIVPIKNNPMACKVVIVSNYDPQSFELPGILRKRVNAHTAWAMTESFVKLRNMIADYDMRSTLVKGPLFNSPSFSGQNFCPPGVSLVQYQNFEEREASRGRTRQRGRVYRKSISPSFRSKSDKHQVMPRARSTSRYHRENKEAFEGFAEEELERKFFHSEGFQQLKSQQVHETGINYIGYFLLLVVTLWALLY